MRSVELHYKISSTGGTSIAERQRDTIIQHVVILRSIPDGGAGEGRGGVTGKCLVTIEPRLS